MSSPVSLWCSACCFFLAEEEDEAPHAVVIWFRREENARGMEGELGTDLGLETIIDGEKEKKKGRGEKLTNAAPG